MIATALALLVAVAVTYPELAGPQHWITRRMMLAEDVPVLVLVALLMIALALQRSPGAPQRMPGFLESPQVEACLVALMGMLAATVIAVGSSAVALDYPYSRDEAMAAFDTRILGTGQLIAPVPPEWRPFVPALQPEFRLEVPGHVAWVSSYLPGNAAIRAALLKLGGGNALANAALFAIAYAALIGLAVRLFPRRPDARILAAVLFATSSQVLFMGQTTYAMASHLALNLLWLWLFTCRTPIGHAGAIAIGALATGLHQIVFHPLFVAPFLLQLLLQRRIALLAVYVGAYGAIGLFWIAYWQFLLAASGVEATAAQGAGPALLVRRVLEMLGYFNLQGAETMVQNLMRFAAWQNPLLLVLSSLGAVYAFGGRTSGADARDGVWWPLVLGFALTVATMFVLLPYQATGWGYRYVHGLIGGLCLLGAFAWVNVVRLEPAQDGKPAGAAAFATRSAAAMTAVSIALIPLHAQHMHATHAPYASAASAIARSGEAAMFIDTTAMVYGNDLVRNSPDLTNRPLVFDFGALDEPRVRELCRRFGRVAVFASADAVRHGIEPQDDSRHPDRRRLDAMWRAARELGCVA